MTRLFGMEVELGDGSEQLAERLYAMGLSESDYLHPYHCHCEGCSLGPWSPQEEHTGGEFVSIPLVWGSDTALHAIEGFGEACLATRVKVPPLVDDSAGNHVHVSHEGMDEAAKHRLFRLFLRYQDDDLLTLARSWQDHMRNYNLPLSLTSYGVYLGDGYGTERRTTVEEVHRLFWEERNTDYRLWPDAMKGRMLALRDETFEFRLWNSTRAAWRLYMHAGLSVAMVTAAIEGEWVEKDDPRPLLDVLIPYADDLTLTLAHRQLNY